MDEFWDVCAMCWVSTQCVYGTLDGLSPVCGKGFSMVRESPYGSTEKYVRACWKSFSAISECRRRITDIMRKPGKRTGGVILRCRLWHRMQGKTVWRMTGTEEGDSLHMRRVSVLRKSGVKFFYFRYFVIMRFCGTAHRCGLLITNRSLYSCPGWRSVFLVSEIERLLPLSLRFMSVWCFLWNNN